VVAALALAAVAIVRGERMVVPSRAIGRLSLAAALNVFAWMGFSTIAMVWLSVAEGALLVYTMPIWATLLVWRSAEPCCMDRLVSAVGRDGVGKRPLPTAEAPVPFKLNQAGRHHIPRQGHKVTNWPAYDASLRQRGSLTIWFTDEAIAAWRAEPRTTRGGQPWYSPLAILTALTLRAVFRLGLRQTEGLIGSVIHLLGLDLPVPDHTTLSRRAATLEVPQPRSSSSPNAGRRAEPVHLLVDSTGLKLCGPGEWLVEKHGSKRRRGWRKLHPCHGRRHGSDCRGGVDRQGR
jgi:hypothetical protein